MLNETRTAPKVFLSILIVEKYFIPGITA